MHRRQPDLRDGQGTGRFTIISSHTVKNTIGQAVSQLGSAASLLRFSQKTTLQAAGVQTESAGIVLFVLPALLETVDP
ncbi:MULTISPECIES: hypothetical protein [unclassified Neisseria]|uniref:hypothetical protein n=1 Tax=unclassified Neisseria TaxID=2623750 RepID=UPI001072B335|nr:MULTISPECIES: hypothetical protein [unclassified Neisseria]MBF0804301.1 hypothetical protein [Neisseria sp. 19428wB4_WF04]TFU42927.1 hypothetical protein E4T99_08080 [Neisseria sp. WF04]